MKEYFKQMKKLYGDKACIGLCFIASANVKKTGCLGYPFSKPILYVYGNKGCGKTTFVKALTRCDSYYTRGKEPSDTSRYIYNNCLIQGPKYIHIEDVNNNSFAYTLSNGYGGAGSYLIASGRYDISEDIALFSKSIVIDLSREEAFSPQEKEDFNILKFIKDHTNDFFHYNFNFENGEHIRNLLKAHSVLEKTIGDIEGRIRNNYLLLLTAYYDFSPIFPYSEKETIEILTNNARRQNDYLNKKNARHAQ